MRCTKCNNEAENLDSPNENAGNINRLDETPIKENSEEELIISDDLDLNLVGTEGYFVAMVEYRGRANCIDLIAVGVVMSIFSILFSFIKISNELGYGMMLVAMLPFLLSEVFWGKSIGKHILKIQVRKRNGEKANPIILFIRLFAKIISFVLIGVVFAIPIGAICLIILVVIELPIEVSILIAVGALVLYVYARDKINFYVVIAFNYAFRMHDIICRTGVFRKCDLERLRQANIISSK